MDMQLFNFVEVLIRARRLREEGKHALAQGQLQAVLNEAGVKGSPFLYNTALNELEITQGKEILISKPRGLGITLTNRCNVRCIMCSVWQDPWDIPQKTVEEIFTFLPYLERIFWQGGEVFLSPYFAELLDRIAEYPHIRQDINTNGLLIDETWAKRLVKVNANIIFSIDGITKETYEYIRRGAKFEDLIRSIETLNKYISDAKKKDADSRTSSTIINLVLMKSNYRELGGFIDFAKKYKFERLQITPVDIGNEENLFLNRDPEVFGYLRKVIPEITRKAQD
ncbi:MAG: radical SAM protein, partial [Candidatus Omnitrophica bacterium]|nr:radical SAM protein [Candidatus Omnitrophota bacterium]